MVTERATYTQPSLVRCASTAPLNRAGLPIGHRQFNGLWQKSSTSWYYTNLKPTCYILVSSQSISSLVINALSSLQGTLTLMETIEAPLHHCIIANEISSCSPDGFQHALTDCIATVTPGFTGFCILYKRNHQSGNDSEINFLPHSNAQRNKNNSAMMYSTLHKHSKRNVTLCVLTA